MKFLSFSVCVCVLALVLETLAIQNLDSTAHHHGKHKHHKGGHHHHHHGHHKGHHKHHGKHGNASVVEHQAATAPAKLTPAAKPTVVGKPTVVTKAPATKVAAPAKPASAPKVSRDEQLVEKMKALELRLAQKKKSHSSNVEKGHLLVMGPIPAGFAEMFVQGVAAAVNVDAKQVTVTKTAAVADQPGVFAVDFSAPPKVVAAVETQASQPDSKLARGNLHSFLVSDDDEEKPQDVTMTKPATEKWSTPARAEKEWKSPVMVRRMPESEGDNDGAAAEEQSGAHSFVASKHRGDDEEEPAAEEATPVQEKGIDIDTAMPYGDLEPFGREDTAQELTEDSVKESDEMVDQLERAEVAEEKRAVFRALTRLRGAAITSFDGVARSQTGNIDEYNKIHKWRETHPLHHLADEESDVSKWAFPDNADF